LPIEKSKIKGSLMVQGTTSDAGKSLLVAGLCRALKRKGISVAPFKPQNMSLNSAVTPCGGEIGRAQALQAIACGLELETDFNPVLLKPTSNSHSQVIINGKAVSQLDASRFGSIKELAFDSVLESYKRLQEKYEVVLIEGAGSPAEVNLRKNDIANMGFAEEVDCPVILISDIDRGGVFAHLKGTLDILSKSENSRVKGMVINKFRGNLDLLKGGLNWIENSTGKKILGVLPYMLDLKLDAEDGIKVHQEKQKDDMNAVINIGVIVLPRISNHTDFEPLLANDNVNITYARFPNDLDNIDLIIIPGSKSVRDDLKFLQDNQWTEWIKRHCRYGGKVLGVCGGFQMLGNNIFDPYGIEGEIGETSGLSLLNIETELEKSKQLKNVQGLLKMENSKDTIVNGYEIHCGKTKGNDLDAPFCELVDQYGGFYDDGAISKDNQIIGTYLHGLFETRETTEAILSWVTGKKESAQDWDTIRESELNRLADMLEENMDIKNILSMIN